VIAVDSEGGAHVSWFRDGGKVMYAGSPGGWSEVDLLGDAETAYGGETDIFVDSNDVVYVAWLDNRNEWDPPAGGNLQGIDVFYAASDTGWTETPVTGGTTFRCFDPSIAVTGNGVIHVTYRRFIDERTGDKHFCHVDSGSGWSETVISDAEDNWLNYSDMVLDSGNNVQTVFSTGVDVEHVFYAGGPGFTNLMLDDSTTSNWWDDRISPAIAAGPSSIIHAVWKDQRNTDTVYASLPNRSEIYYADSSAGWANLEIGNTTDRADPWKKHTPSIGVDQIGVVHVLYVQQEGSEYHRQPNLFYTNSLDWETAINITNIAEDPVEDMEGMLEPQCRFSVSQQALAVSADGVVHITWAQRYAGEEDYRVYYTNSNMVSFH
jgi:hypothetical protein